MRKITEWRRATRPVLLLPLALKGSSMTSMGRANRKTLRAALAAGLIGAVGVVSFSIPCLGCERSASQSVHACCPDSDSGHPEQANTNQHGRDSLGNACGCPSVAPAARCLVEAARLVFGTDSKDNSVFRPAAAPFAVPTLRIVKIERPGGRLYVAHSSLLI